MNLFTGHNKRSEVDIQVAQELKNNKEFVYQTNQALQNLSTNFIALSLQYEKLIAKAESDRIQVIIQFENLRGSVEEITKIIEQRVGDVETKISIALDKVKKVHEKLEQEYLKQSSFNYECQSREEEMAKIDGHISKTDREWRDTLYKLKEEFKDHIAALKVVLTPKPIEGDPIQEKIDENLKSFRVDFEGLVREISILKRSVAYDQKKFEHIYTLIERLKEKLP